MNDLLYHSAPAVARDLSERLVGLIRNLRPDEASRLQRMLTVDEHERPQMVLTGQYSSGKSTLIEALTDGAYQVPIGSAVTTKEVEVFDWDGLVDLVDTPGVQAGWQEHDERAEEALRSADLVLFTVTVDLFDDRLVEHLRHVTEDLRKAYRSYVDAPGWTRWHRWRCDQAAYTLSAGGRGPGAPNLLARWSRNLIATVGAVIGGATPRRLQDKIADEEERNRLV